MTEKQSRRRFLRTSLAAGSLFVAPGLLAGCGAGSNESGTRADTARGRDEEDTWVTLFDGESLDGWHTNPEPIGHGTGGRWTVEDGAIVGQQDPPGSGNGGILLSDQRFGDFELELDLYPDWGPDSGLFLRSNEQGQCFQVMVDYHDGGNIGHIYGEGTGGFNARPFSINGDTNEEGVLNELTTEPFEGYEDHPLAYTCSSEAWLEAWKIGGWNTVRTRCVGQYPTITTWINDVKVCEFDGATYEHSRYDRQEVFETLGRRGHVALQVHGGESAWPANSRIRWKNIRVRRIGGEAAAVSSGRSSTS